MTAGGKAGSVRLDLGRRLATAAAAASVAAAGWGLTACGSDDNLRVFGSSAPRPGSCAGKNALTGEGATAQQNAIALFSQVWARGCPGKTVSYNPTGSGAGREQFIAGHVDFAGTDLPLAAEQLGPAEQRCGGNPAWDLPLTFGPIALAYNLTDVPELTLSADAVAKIFSGSITMWNDPILAALNPGVPLPGTRIDPIYRADSSGTTDTFQKYLAAAAPQSWTKGVGTEFLGGVGEGAAKSGGVLQAVKVTPGAIGYVEQGFADHAGLAVARIDSGSGGVALTEESARNAVNIIDVGAAGNDLVLEMSAMYGTHQPGVYPLVLASYEVVCSKGYDAGTAAAIKSFLTSAANEGQSGLSAAGYVPLPDKVRERLITAIDALQ